MILLIFYLNISFLKNQYYQNASYSLYLFACLFFFLLLIAFINYLLFFLSTSFEVYKFYYISSSDLILVVFLSLFIVFLSSLGRVLFSSVSKSLLEFGDIVFDTCSINSAILLFFIIDFYSFPFKLCYFSYNSFIDESFLFIFFYYFEIRSIYSPKCSLFFCLKNLSIFIFPTYLSTFKLAQCSFHIINIYFFVFKILLFFSFFPILSINSLFSDPRIVTFVSVSDMLNGIRYVMLMHHSHIFVLLF